MQIVYLDESGYTQDWKTGMVQQPFYVLSAVSIPVAKIVEWNEEIRGKVASLKLPFQKTPLGKGFEIKANEVARGANYWAQNNEARNSLRSLMLQAPKKCGGTAFICVIDKNALVSRYKTPGNPYMMALGYTLERIEHLMRSMNDHAICVYDQNKRLDSELHEFAIEMVRDGDEIIPLLFGYKFPIEHILEFTLGNSKNSVGLQIADFFASMAYHYWKENKPKKCGWWDELQSCLHRVDGHLDGYGLKEFPI